MAEKRPSNDSDEVFHSVVPIQAQCSIDTVLVVKTKALQWGHPQFSIAQLGEGHPFSLVPHFAVAPAFDEALGRQIVGDNLWCQHHDQKNIPVEKHVCVREKY